MIRAAFVLALGGCSVIFMERVPTDHVRGETVHCTSTKGFAIWDAAMAGVAAVGAAAAFTVDVPEDSQTTVYALGAIDVAAALGYLISASKGAEWSEQCITARDQADARQHEDMPQASQATAKPALDERKTVFGSRPLSCAVTAPDVGECFLDLAKCDEAAATGTATCEQRDAGSCFNATKTLDGTKVTVCAVSIKDCEARRGAYAANPDYSATRCGIYRFDNR
jgi:hypothetical protein